MGVGRGVNSILFDLPHEFLRANATSPAPHNDRILNLLRAHFKFIRCHKDVVFGRHSNACNNILNVIVGSLRTHLGFDLI